MPRRSFDRPCWVEIDVAALRHNCRALLKRLSRGASLLAVVKANAYGHGLVACAKTVVRENVAMLGVTSIEEGIALRKAGIGTPVLVLGSLYPFHGFPLLFQYRLTPTISSIQAADALAKMARARRKTHAVHLKIDTGFGRIGVRAGDSGQAHEFVSAVSQMKGLKVEGIYTQFSSADMDEPYTRKQHKLFRDLCDALQESGVTPRWIHAANSSALLRFPETHGTLVRPGLTLYGVAPFASAEKQMPLRPVLTWKTRVVFLKTIPRGFRVSYAQTWVAKRPTRVATLAVGYADGYPRMLSNRGQVLIGGQRASVIGRVTMDMMMVDVTDIPRVRVGDEVVLIGKQKADSVAVEEIARWAETNAYETLCRISDRVPRVTLHG